LLGSEYFEKSGQRIRNRFQPGGVLPYEEVVNDKTLGGQHEQIRQNTNNRNRFGSGNLVCG
jgi:hypothetical protein